jgi:hypothetical protein
MFVRATRAANAGGRENIRHWYARLIGSDSAAHDARFIAAKVRLTLHPPHFEWQHGDDA